MTTYEHGREGELDYLVELAVAGDESAVPKLLRLLQPVVIRYCRARIGRAQCTYTSADDVAQDVLMAVLTTLPNYRPGQLPFLAYVLGIARNKVADFFRASKREAQNLMAEPPDRPDLQPGPEESAVRGEISREVTALLDTLPAHQREILIMRIVVGLSAEETAKTIESTAGAVRVVQHRALAKLRKLFNADMEPLTAVVSVAAS